MSRNITKMTLLSEYIQKLNNQDKKEKHKEKSFLRAKMFQSFPKELC